MEIVYDAETIPRVLSDRRFRSVLYNLAVLPAFQRKGDR